MPLHPFYRSFPFNFFRNLWQSVGCVNDKTSLLKLTAWKLPHNPAMQCCVRHNILKKKWIMLYSPFMSRNAQVNVGVNFFIQTQRQWAKKRCYHDIIEEVNGHLVLSRWIKGKASVSLTGNGKTGWFVVILLHDGRVCKWTSTMEKNEG